MVKDWGLLRKVLKDWGLLRHRQQTAREKQKVKHFLLWMD